MLVNIKLENDSKPYEKIAADNADKALNCWLLNHPEYYQKGLMLDGFKRLDIDINGQVYEVSLTLTIDIEKIR